MVRGCFRSARLVRGTRPHVIAVRAMLTVVASGCGGGASNGVTNPVNSAPVLAEVRVSFSRDTLAVGDTATVSAEGLDQNRAALRILTPTWSTTSPGVATVSATGVVSAVAPGRTTLVASVDGKKGEGSLIIIPAAIARLAITPDAPRLAAGATLQLTASAIDFQGRPLPGRRIDWSTSDATKATVTSTGVLTALASGAVTVTAISEGVSAAIVLTVTTSLNQVETLTLTPPVGSLTVGGSLQLALTLKDAAGNVLTGRDVTWSVTGIGGVNAATVSATGLVTALSPGAVIVEAFSEGQHGAATIRVADDLDASIVVNFAEPVMNALVGDTLRVDAGVNSLYPITSVIAAVAGSPKTLALKFQRIGALGNAYLWVGLLDITDLPTGAYVVQVTATNDRGGRGVGSIQFQRDTRVGKGGSNDAPKVK
ncbi:hypothetical protein BH11GEM1_BH11GEM1_30540 [soil metagenome]